eukprot:jgi/Botrbrau1/16709/Bobra.0263s0006.1
MRLGIVWSKLIWLFPRRTKGPTPSRGCFAISVHFQYSPPRAVSIKQQASMVTRNPFSCNNYM